MVGTLRSSLDQFGFIWPPAHPTPTHTQPQGTGTCALHTPYAHPWPTLTTPGLPPALNPWTNPPPPSLLCRFSVAPDPDRAAWGPCSPLGPGAWAPGLCSSLSPSLPTLATFPSSPMTSSIPGTPCIPTMAGVGSWGTTPGLGWVRGSFTACTRRLKRCILPAGGGTCFVWCRCAVAVATPNRKHAQHGQS